MPHPDVTSGRFKLGAIPSPRSRLLRAEPFVPRQAPPSNAFWKASKLQMWGNDQMGDCVSAEEAAAMASWYAQHNLSDQTLIAWARQHGFANGATLTDVMDAMAKYGIGDGGTTYKDGPYRGVDYSNESILQGAIAEGPVKIAIDHSALPSGAGNQNGWVGTGGSPNQYGNSDHCVGLFGYGVAQWLFQQLGVALPSSLQPSTPGYLLFTWSTLGFVDHAWVMSTCSEAWVRSPTTVGYGPPPGPPPWPPYV